MLDDFIPGSHIGSKAISETKMANAVIFDLGGQKCLLIDTPGFDDTEGDIDNIINALSIAKVDRRDCSWSAPVL